MQHELTKQQEIQLQGQLSALNWPQKVWALRFKVTCTSYEALLEAFRKKHTDTVGSEDLQGISAKAHMHR